jgi:hypothetical protein
MQIGGNVLGRVLITDVPELGGAENITKLGVR